ncbi:NF-X1-type zinc finger protein NFXL1-like [Amphibalanus amphitrite]|uniref:NF-X1-type zinc finger protein NFXL1-like n=1 Tax=Amphibalanus amphitrite TaxID=1232801 RepID=UPI001C904382|nr:NF-X1-type zinc finger protein NFXL1-like [Amphibalanus amphitrite]
MPGRGAGRGRSAPAWGGAGRGRPAPAWGGAGQKQSQRPAAVPAEPTQRQTERRFAEACAQIRAASEKHVSQYQLSDSEDEQDDVDDDTREQILGRLCDRYVADDKSALGNTSEYLQRALNAEANTCLICIGSVKRTDPLWCCSGCWVGFHLHCVQTWARDSISQQQRRLESGDAKTEVLQWHCPNCRRPYGRDQVPSRYRCYCGKTPDPPPDPWLLPHACDQRCERPLRPECGHRCLLQCHPGPCPPCPVTVSTRCHCGRSGPDTRRCGNKVWSCRKPCGRTLDCNTHPCRELCHPGECPPCPKTSRQPCNCGQKTELRPCASPRWQCEKVCGRPLSCGHHRCERVCHSGACGPCERAGPRRCPCGRTELEAPCHQDVPPCGDTCDKWLACGVHRCAQRCHTGACGRCLQLRVKRCRCGRKEKELVCDKEFTCDIKCKRLKDCGKHTCNRKCCTGDCPPCELSCGRTLPCGQHKCSSPCHPGPCYPCGQTAELRCPCGATRLTVPCGRQRGARPPRCRHPCPAPTDCHHPARPRHPCHAGDCPPCSLTCGQPLPCGRGHSCPQPCHDRVQQRFVSQKKAATPWEKTEDRVVTVSLPCPPCQAPVSTPCLGGHAEYPMPCTEARPQSCGRPCGRLLLCGNHRCQQLCHTVEGAPDSETAGTTCDVCEAACSRDRPPGCQHACERGCHAEPCPPCRQHRRLRCHCQLGVLHVRCHELSEADEQQKERLLCCGNPCPRTLECGHRCAAVCHPGPCPAPEGGCATRLKQRCPCGRRAQTTACRERAPPPDCDDKCREVAQAKEQERAAREEAAAAEEAARQQQAVEELERKLTGGRRKERRGRRQQTAEPEPSSAGRWLLLAAAVAVLAVTAGLLLYQ